MNFRLLIQKGLGIVSPSHFVYDFSQKIFLTLYILLTDKVIAFTYWHIGHSKPPNIGPQDIPGTSPSNIPKTSPKDPIWPFQERPNLTSWGRLEMTSRGRLNQTFNGRPWELIRDIPGTFPGRHLEDLKGKMEHFLQN